MDVMMRVTDTLKSLRETRLSGLRSPTEFFDYQRVSRPANFNQVTERVTYNTRYFSGNYGAIIALLAVYCLIKNSLLLIALGLLVGGFIAINRWAPDPMQVGEHTVTQKHLYAGLFILGIPLLLLSDPFGTFFWLVGASGLIIMGHAAFMERGIESEYTTVEGAV